MVGRRRASLGRDPSRQDAARASSTTSPAPRSTLVKKAWITRTAGVIASAVLAGAGVTAAASIQGSTENSGVFEQIDRLIQREMEDSRIPGVALAIVQGREIVHRRGFGQDGRGNPVTPQTPFPIGSLTKSFTALAARRLSEAGKIVLDDPVRLYLPSFQVADADASSRITIRHLLNQTSGFSRASGINPAIEESEASMAALVAGFDETPLNRPVGQSYEYSNLNFVTLGLLVQTVSEQPWAEYIERQVFDPIGMTNSYTTFVTAREGGMTAVHRYWFGVPIKSALPYLPGLAPTGYLASSAEDMGRYLTLYLRGGMAQDTRLLSENGIRQMLRPATNEVTVRLLSTTFTARYAEGWFVGRFGAAPDARWHLGQLPSFTAWMILLPDTGQAVVMLINAGSQMELGGGNSVLSRLPQGVVNLLRNERPPTGTSIRRFYAIFNSVVVIVLGASIWLIVWVARSRLPVLAGGAATWSSAAAIAPMVGGLGLNAVLLLGVPMAIGTNWRTMSLFAPDLAVAMGTVSILSMTVAAVRAGRLVQRYRIEQSQLERSKT
jgi:CubicO group peptidase (beta-lactamase class C family)